MVYGPGDSPMLLAPKSRCVGIKDKLRKGKVRKLMAKYPIQDFETQRIVMILVHKLRGIALQFTETVASQVSSMKAAPKFDKSDARNQSRKFRAMPFNVRRQTYCHVSAKRPAPVVKKLVGKIEQDLSGWERRYAHRLRRGPDAWTLAHSSLLASGIIGASAAAARA
jgi:hypothetical protein